MNHRDGVLKYQLYVIFYDIRRRFLHPVGLRPLVAGQEGLCDLMSLGAQFRYGRGLPERSFKQRAQGEEAR